MPTNTTSASKQPRTPEHPARARAARAITRGLAQLTAEQVFAVAALIAAFQDDDCPGQWARAATEASWHSRRR